MRAHRLMVVAGVAAAALLAVLVSVAMTARSEPRGKATPPAQSGPAQQAAERARADLAAKLGVAPEAVEIVSSEAHTWPDTSLGLPEPGMMYAEVITEGYVVSLRHGGRSYVYHVAEGIVRPKPEAGGGPEGEPTPMPELSEADLARERAVDDLVARLGVTRDAVETVSVEAHTWSDASLGLPEPGMAYAQVLTDGFIVTLRSEGKTYVYHVAGEAVKLNPGAP